MTLEELYDRYSKRVWGYARVMAPSMAEDLAAEAFLALGKRLLRGVPPDPLGYLLATVRSRAIDESRRRKPVPLVDAPARAIESNEEALEAARRLEPPLAEAVALRIFAGMTFEEAAAFAGIPRGTMESRYARAIEELSCLLREYRT